MLINNNYVSARVGSLECAVYYHRLFAGSTTYHDILIPKRSSVEVCS